MTNQILRPTILVGLFHGIILVKNKSIEEKAINTVLFEYADRRRCDMIKIIAGGKKNSGDYLELISEYEKRLRKPFEIKWEFFEEEKLTKKLEEWPFSNSQFVICCDERGENISSDEYSRRLEKAFFNGKDIIILIGGAYGFSEIIREKANFVWSFSKLVFPHMIARLIVTEQIYRAQEISRGGKYHHE